MRGTFLQGLGGVKPGDVTRDHDAHSAHVARKGANRVEFRAPEGRRKNIQWLRRHDDTSSDVAEELLDESKQTKSSKVKLFFVSSFHTNNFCQSIKQHFQKHNYINHVFSRNKGTFFAQLPQYIRYKLDL